MSTTDRKPTAGIATLISHLEQAINEKEGPAKEQAKLASLLEQAEQRKTTTMSAQELKTYLDNLNKAIELLTVPEN